MRSFAAIVATLLVGCSGPQPDPPSRPAPPPPEQPSVLLVTLDTTRADRLGPYGYALADTPTYDRLAKEGTVFERAYAVTPLTIPAHSSIMTGRAPPSHGVRDNGDFVLGEDQITLAERFRDAGYATAAFTSAFPTQRRWGFGQGFDVYQDPLQRLPSQLDWRDQRPAGEVVDGALEVLPELAETGRPLFVWLHLFDAHWPYKPPEPYASEHAGRPYDGEIAYADSQVARVLEWWERNRPGSYTLITADHGEGLGDGGEQTHGFLLHDGTIRIPMILHGPGIDATRIADPVGQVDIAPTLLTLTGLPLHDGLQGADMRKGGSDELYSEALTGQFNLGLSPLYATTGDEGRYTEGGWGAFYPVKGSSVPVVADARDAKLPQRKEELARFRAELDEVVAPSTALDAEALDLLSQLGYLGGDVTAAAGDIDPRDVIDVIPLTWQARQLIGMGRFPRADQLIQQLEARMPDTFGVDLLRAQLLRRQGSFELAREAYADLYLRSPSSTVALQLAGLWAQSGDWQEALSWFEEARELQPNSPEAMAGIVRSLQALGRPEEAEELANAYLAIYPDHAELALIRAEIALANADYETAAKEGRAGLQEMPYSPWAWTIVGQALWELGDPDDAIDHLKEAVKLNPYNAVVRMRMAECLLEVGRNAEAVRTMAPMARLLPDTGEVQELYGRAQAALAEERSR